jgi:hypothetical protein
MGVADVLEPTMVITNLFIAPDGTVVDTIVMKIDPPHVQQHRALAASRQTNVDSDPGHTGGK